MSCPLCGGPLHVADAGQFVCERTHAMDAQQLQVATASRVTLALWSSIEALQSEAEALRAIAVAGHGDGSTSELAAQADKDALVLRELVLAHLPPGHDGGGG